ncbi:MAG: hypothetical protein M0P77_07630 [Firmicutes bacterium]|nr:hypothetical protein [Bacillota bacterium]
MTLKHQKDPLIFQGKRKGKKYFEGWYFKQVSWDAENIISIIPGISKDPLDPHCFVQVITLFNGLSNHEILRTHYYKYSIDEFKIKDEPFRLVVGDSLFDSKGIMLNLKNESCRIKGDIKFSPFTKIRRKITSPSAMGYFAYFNFMECNHDIISMNHSLNGKLMINEKEIDLNQGKGYIEKDWGMSFPREYIWLQSNHFGEDSASIMLSIARIPFLGMEFQGFICNLTLNGREFRFATYNNSKIIKFSCVEGLMKFVIAKGKYELIINGEICDSLGSMKAPGNGAMNKIIKEGLDGYVDIKLSINSRTLFEGRGAPCAIEIVK